MNSNLLRKLETENCTVAIAHRGPWQMLVIYEKTSHCIITFMREKRFAELCKAQRRRSHMHYLDMLAKQFNKDLQANQQQCSLFPHSFSDENLLPELVQTLLSDLGGDVTVVRNHVLVLFETSGYQLSHIRAVKITPNLDIAQNCDQDWSQYISVNESTVVEKVTNPVAPEFQPSGGLKLKPKAITRKQDKPQIQVLDQDIQKRG
jgi:electron transfer flavoprotein alpha subunit